jgi:hypothetical protein
MEPTREQVQLAQDITRELEAGLPQAIADNADNESGFSVTINFSPRARKAKVVYPPITRWVKLPPMLVEMD